jgi:DNA-directed RNA polymerase subunit RPC12/RpoP
MHEEYDKQIDLLPNSSRIKRATKYPCPHCGGKFKLSDTCGDVQCRDCWHIYHSDYILTMYEDSLE